MQLQCIFPPTARPLSRMQLQTWDWRCWLSQEIKSRAAVRSLEEPCECIQEIQFTHIYRHIERQAHSLWGLLGQWFAFERQISILCLGSLTKEETQTSQICWTMTQTQRDVLRLVLSMWQIFFSVCGSTFIFHKHHSDNIFCWQWSDLLQSNCTGLLTYTSLYARLETCPPPPCRSATR